MIEGLLIAVAISMDSLSVGVAYGIKNIKVPLRSLIILDFISVTLLSFGFFAGNLLTKLVPTVVTEFIGASILVAIGLWFIAQSWLNYKYPKEKVPQLTSIAVISINSLGIAINILRDPSKADLDISGIIDTKEAVLLGIALAIDSLAIGIAVSLSSVFIILFTLLLVAVMNLVFLLSGMFIGRNYIASHLKEKTAFIPGLILLLLGLTRLI
ncbi:sporulation membrane protein YtaF [Clostridium formicaceticum]|uniref:Manganese efflux pump MntP n=1 Tax=Clostridium formicaceticum TaxID=1497 RepID=A0AAC9RT11_9CLOT|nr:sporulation membrane protein YtaF [Clostridium formicaceticum]AOY75031.1 sporulation membrane protein YtaF [Clostridium formicaceticum]ARE89450.1 manganese efflux pump MntP [Clostridium formicaceticum]